MESAELRCLPDERLAALYEAHRGEPMTADRVAVEKAFAGRVEWRGMTGGRVETPDYYYTWNRHEAAVYRTRVRRLPTAGLPRGPKKSDGKSRSAANGAAPVAPRRKLSTVREDD